MLCSISLSSLLHLYLCIYTTLSHSDIPPQRKFVCYRQRQHIVRAYSYVMRIGEITSTVDVAPNSYRSGISFRIRSFICSPLVSIFILFGEANQAQILVIIQRERTHTHRTLYVKHNHYPFTCALYNITHNGTHGNFAVVCSFFLFFLFLSFHFELTNQFSIKLISIG